MADTAGGAYIGFPKQPAAPRNEEAAARLSAIMRGFVGEDTAGSVLDPNRQSANDANNLGQIAGLASDLPGPKSLMMAMAGMLRAGGKSGLRLAHSSIADNFLNGKIPPEFYNFSQAITGNNEINRRFGDALVVPRLGKFDPKDSPTTLFRHDSGTPTWHGQSPMRFSDREWGRPVGSREALEDAELAYPDAKLNASRRLADRFELPNSPLYSPQNPGLVNRQYSSFKEFENAPSGAKTLKDAGDYAELKSWGPTQFNGDSFSGLLLPASTIAKNPDEVEILKRLLREKGMGLKPYSSDAHLVRQYDKLQGVK